jgi:hypothetical protein
MTTVAGKPSVILRNNSAPLIPGIYISENTSAANTASGGYAASTLRAIQHAACHGN